MVNLHQHNYEQHKQKMTTNKRTTPLQQATTTKKKNGKHKKDNLHPYDIQNGRMGPFLVQSSTVRTKQKDVGTRRDGSYGSKSRSTSALNHMKLVSKRAALASKRKIWDTNDASIDAAQTAVDHWESTYNTLRSVLVTSVSSAKTMYETAKNGASGIEHHLLVPVRDYVILPAFSGVERVTCVSVEYIQSDEARKLADYGLDVVRKTPFVGEGVLAPALVQSARCVQTVWEVAKYPIPDKDAVRLSVDRVMTGTKWAITTTSREIYFYAKLVDATITRSLMHTQWRVLGSGPYATLDHNHRREVIDHICERYLSLQTIFARYELAAHIRAHNRCLYDDLVVSGLLLERCRKSRENGSAEGEGNNEDDMWLLPCPIYRKKEENESLMLLKSASPQQKIKEESSNQASYKVTPIWFYLPYQNGKRPGKDVPWVRFQNSECDELERGFVSFMKTMAGDLHQQSDLIVDKQSKAKERSRNLTEAAKKNPSFTQIEVESDFTANPKAGKSSTMPLGGTAPSASTNINGTCHQSTKYPTIAQWYEPDLSRDIFVDKKRHVVSFLRSCCACRSPMDQFSPPLLRRKADQRSHFLCDECLHSASTPVWSADSQKDFPAHHVEENIILSPPIRLVMRPTMWRFHGPGDEVRRGVWLLDTKRNGLQPYSDESSAVLEDAYLFLKWSFKSTRVEGGKSDIDSVLLTVQVASPDGDEQQLVQFRSLSQVTAIQKTLGGAFSVFKSRVYRGANVLSELAVNDHHNETSDAQKSSCSAADAPNTQQDVENCAEINLDTTPLSAEDAKSADDETNAAISLAAPLCESIGSSTSTAEAVVNDCNADDDTEHLILVVHGIGEMLRSTDVFGMALGPLSSIVDCCTWLRKNHEEVLDANCSDTVKDGKATQIKSNADHNVFKGGQVEYIPVEWHEAFAIQSRRSSNAATESDAKSTFGEKMDSNRTLLPTVSDISLRTIPHLRAFANDTALDILYFMSPDYHDIIVDIVTQEMNFVVERFRRLTGFSGKVSIMAHSLGSIITWDILSHQITSGESSSDMQYTATNEFRSSWAQSLTQSEENIMMNNVPLHLETENSQTSQKKNSSEQYPQLSFQVANTFLLGSPVAVFLMIRNQHQPLDENYALPGCRRVFNIFHPYDPAAYRIEPLINPKNADAEAEIITHWKGGFRVQYQTKILWKKIVDNTWKAQKDVIAAVEKGMTEFGMLDSKIDGLAEEEEDDYVAESVDLKLQPVNCGRLNQGRRIDYMLQEKEIEISNEYVFALAAHSTYWGEKDLSSFVAKQLFYSRNESDRGMILSSGTLQGVSINQATVLMSSPGDYFEYN